MEMEECFRTQSFKDQKDISGRMEEYPNDQIISLRPKRRGQQKKFVRITSLIARYPR